MSNFISFMNSLLTTLKDFSVSSYLLFIDIVTYKYFFHIVIGILFLLSIKWIRKQHADWNKGWLSELIEEKIKEAVSKKESDEKSPAGKQKFLFLARVNLIETYETFVTFFKKKIPSDLKNYYLPSFTTFSLCILLFLFLFYITHAEINYSSFLNPSGWSKFMNRQFVDNNGFSNVVAVIAGLVSIVFALVIFVAESIRDAKTIDQKRTLLAISKLWYLITFTILSLLNFLVFKIKFISFVFPLLIAGLSIYVFWKVIIHLLNREVQEENNLSFLKDRIRDNIFESIRERLGTNIIMEKLGADKEINFEYTISKDWITDGPENYIFIESEADGRITDVNLEELKKLANYLQDEARRLNFSLSSSSNPIVATGGDMVTETRAEPQAIKKVYLLKRFGEYLPPNSIFTEGSKIIFAIPKEFGGNPYIERYVRGMIPHIFRLSQGDAPSSLFRKELQGIKDRLIQAVRTTSIGAIEDLKQTYLNLTEEFLDILHKFGGGYTAEQAKKERGNLFEGWNEIRWLREDVRELIMIASDSNNQDIISDIIFLPKAIAIRAFRAKDHLLFQEFIHFDNYIYHLAQAKEDGRIKDFMIDRSWRHLKEISDLYIQSKIQDRHQNTSIEDLQGYKDFVFQIYKTFQSLIKSSFQKKDFKSFEVFVAEFSKLYRHIDREYANVENFKFALTQTTDQTLQKELQTKIDILEEKEKIVESIKLARKQILFAVTAKVFDSHRKNQADQDVKKFFNAIDPKITSNIKELTEIFDSCRDFNTEDYWGWSDDEIIADGEVHIIDAHSKLDYYYCAKALRILSGMTSDQIEAIDMPSSRDLAFLAEDRPETLITKLNEIRANPANFDLAQTAIDKIDAFVELLTASREKQEKKEEEFLKTAPIDPDKLIEFKKDIHKSFTESGRIRALINRYNAYEDRISETPGKVIPSYGYNQIDEKAAFLKTWYVHYGERGEQYGEGMANSEDQIFFEAAVNGIDNKVETTPNKLFATIKQKIKELGLQEPVIIQSLDHLIEYDSIRGSEHFIDKWRNDCPKTKISDLSGFLGVLKFGAKTIPVFDIFVRDRKLDNKVIITDLSKLGTWEQYSPIDNPEDAGLQDGIFYLRVADLNIDDTLRNKILGENSTWLQEEEDPEGYLRQRILINLYQKFRYVVKDQKKGIVISVLKTEDK